MATPPKIQPPKPEIPPEAPDVGAPEEFGEVVEQRDFAALSQKELVKSSQKESQYQPQEARRDSSPGERSFGHKINVNPELARQNQMSSPQPQASARFEGPQSQFLPQAKPMPQAPQPQEFSRVLQSKAFQTGFQNTPLAQKLQQQSVQTAANAALPADVAAARPEALTRGEVLQLFALRHRGDLNKDEREALRKLIRFEVAAQNRAREKVVSIQSQAESSSRKDNPDALMRAEKQQNQDLVHRDLLDRLARSAESIFERILQRVLGEGRSAVGDLPNEGKPTLPVKENAEWEAFFARVTGLDSTLVESSADSQTLQQILFRGLYQSNGQTKIVSDIALLENGEMQTFKFAQILLQNPKIAELLASLKPGQTLPEEVLKTLGAEIAFLKLVHSVAGVRELSDMEKQALLKQFRREISTGYQKNLESELRGRRPQKPKDDFIWAGDQFDKKQERRGLQTVLTYLTYFALAATAAFCIYFIFKSLF